MTLRKQKIDALILERREISNSSLFYDNRDKKNYEIDIQLLNIDPELYNKQYNSAEELILQANILIKMSDDLDSIKFGVNLLRKFLAASKDIPVLYLFKLEITDTLNNLIEKHNHDLNLIVNIYL